MPNSSSRVEYVLQKDRFFIVGGLVFISLLSWFYIVYLYRQMIVMDMNALLFSMPMTPVWAPTDFVLLFLMWFVMMIAMMTPSVAPLILLFAMFNRQRKIKEAPFVSTLYLLVGYFLIWAGFSVVATLLQWALQQVSLLNPEMKTTSKFLGGIIMIIAGVFQFTSLKKACLNFCRNPVDFIHLNWKEGKAGALRMGIENGWYCLGCCWALMALLFVTGIMNILWIGIVAFFVLLEKVAPKAIWISVAAGILLIIYGCIYLLK